MNVRLADENDLGRVNELRRQVHALHAAGLPEVFKPGFPEALRDHVYTVLNDPEQDIAVAELDGVIRGYAVLHRIGLPENPFRLRMDFLDIDEFGVDEAYRRRGVGTALIAFIRDYAREKDVHRIGLNMWEFNAGALAFYEAAGFTTCRRYMGMDV